MSLRSTDDQSKPPGESAAPARAHGLLLVGHGTRHPTGIAEVERLTALVAERWHAGPTRLGYLELAEPSVEQAVAELIADGAHRVTFAPLLLFAAGHMQDDLPRLTAAAVAGHRGLRVDIAPHLGCHQRLIDLSAQRFLEAIGQTGQRTEVGGARRPGTATAPGEFTGPGDGTGFGAGAVTEASGSSALGQTLLLLVGRGSQHPTANAEMAAFARLRWERTPVGWYEVAFTAMAEPSLDRAIEVVARLPFTRVVVQPHLLFAGELVERVDRTVEQAARRHPRIAWISAQHLGPHPLLAEAVLHRAACARPQPAPASSAETPAAGLSP